MVLPLMYECESLVLVRLSHWVKVGPLIHEPPEQELHFLAPLRPLPTHCRPYPRVQRG